MSTLAIQSPYGPRRIFVPFHERQQRWACIVAHRRAGKTTACINDTIGRALQCKLPNPRFAYIAPLRNQAKAVAWDMLKHFTRMLPGTEYNESELRADLIGGIRINLYGADNPDAVRGVYLDGCILDEIGDMSPRMLPEIIRPALSDRRGWLTAIGTSKGKNAFYDMHQVSLADPSWFSANLKASETGVIPADELASARKMMSRDQYAREYENDFDAAIEGAIYRNELERARADGRVCSVPYDEAVPVHVSWDLGIGDAMALWFWQMVGKELHLIDFYENSGEALGHYFGVMRARPYRYGDMLLPHDAAARELGTGKSREEVFRANDFRVIIGARLDAGERIDAARMAFPRMWFDAKRCAPGLSALASYQRTFNARLNEFSEQPNHNWASHACFVGQTEVLTSHGRRRIMDLQQEGLVLTPWGMKPYHSPRMTLANAQLVEVTFAGGYSVRCTPDHLFLTESGWTSAEHLGKGSLILSCLTPSANISRADSIESGLVNRITAKVQDIFTGLSGRMRLARSRLSLTSTIETTTRAITSSAIWNAFPHSCTCLATINGSRPRLEISPVNVLPIGIALRPVELGIPDTLLTARVGLSGNESRKPANSAPGVISGLSAGRAYNSVFAPTTANRWLAITASKRLLQRAEVWDLTVPSVHCFSLANGATVHNSDAFGEGVIGLRDRTRKPEAKPKTRPPVAWGNAGWMGG